MAPQLHLLSTEFAVLALAASLLAAAALYDLGYRLIPDFLPGMLAGLAITARLAEGWSSLGVALLVSLVVFALLGFLALRGLIGGGDVKLGAAAALLVPVRSADDFVLATALAGGVLALLYLLAGLVLRARRRPSGRPASRLARIARTEAWRIRRGGPLPYGIAIAAGAVLSVVEPDQFSTIL